MLDTKMKDAFRFIAPSQVQAEEMLDNITRAPQRKVGIQLTRRPVMAVCSLVLALALVIGVFPTLQTNQQDKTVIAFDGLTMTVHAAEPESGAITVDMDLFGEFKWIDIFLYTSLMKDSNGGEEYTGYDTIIAHTLFTPPEGHSIGMGSNYYVARMTGGSTIQGIEPSISLTLFREPIYEYEYADDMGSMEFHMLDENGEQIREHKHLDSNTAMAFQAFDENGTMLLEGGLDLWTGKIIEMSELPPLDSKSFIDSRQSPDSYVFPGTETIITQPEVEVQSVELAAEEQFIESDEELQADDSALVSAIPDGNE